MDKPVIFLSHSTKDREIMLKIKKLLTDRTNNTVSFFLSSDGQSIPIGSNWVYKIQEALDQCDLMFVFISPNSINTQWLYFETGYAYSKSVKVVPVGILKMDIGRLKAPISLLQGFNIQDENSFGNIISVINNKFNFSFNENITKKNYEKIFVGKSKDYFKENVNIIKTVRFRGKASKDVDIFNYVIKFYEKNNLDYTIDENYFSNFENYKIDTVGISFHIDILEDIDNFYLLIDPYYIDEGLEKARDILSEIEEKLNNNPEFSITLTNYSFVVKEAYQVMARLSEYNIRLKKDKKYLTKDNITFWLENEKIYIDENDNIDGDCVINFSMDLYSIKFEAVNNIIDILKEAQVIKIREYMF